MTRGLGLLGNERFWLFVWHATPLATVIFLVAFVVMLLIEHRHA